VQISPKELNGILFGNGSEFEGKLFAACKLTKGTAEPWHIGEEGYTRRVTYLTAPSTLIKSVKATEIQVRCLEMHVPCKGVSPNEISTTALSFFIGNLGEPESADSTKHTDPLPNA
jgi:hypothetical protein